MAILEWLQAWYHAKCDGEWEHTNGIKIDTLDNPGWSVQIDLGQLGLDPRHIVVEESEKDWIRCSIQAERFEGYGDPAKLGIILETFREWVGWNGSGDAN